MDSHVQAFKLLLGMYVLCTLQHLGMEAGVYMMHAG